MADELIDLIAEAICDADDYYWNLLTPEEREPYFKRAEAVVAALQLTPDERWVPIAKDGSRWKPRTYTQAIEALASPGDSWKLTHVVHERSYRTPWVEVRP